MSKLWPLFKVQVKITWRGFWEKSNTKSKWSLLLLPLIALGFLPLLVLIFNVYAGILSLTEIGMRHDLVLIMGLSFGQLICLVFGIMYIISAFYFAEDLKTLVPLPIKPREILLSKFLLVVVTEYLTVFPLVIPALIVYGRGMDVSWTYLPFAVLVLILLPIFPLAIAAVIAMLVMRVSKFSRNPDFVRVIGALFGVVFAIGIQFVIRGGNQPFSPDMDQLQALLEAQSGIVEQTTRLMPTSLWGAGALKAADLGTNLMNLGLYVGFLSVLLVLLGRLGERVFLGGLLGAQDTRGSGKVMSREELAQASAKTRSPLMALYLKEWRLLWRNAAFLIHALIPMVLLPVAILLPVIRSGDLQEVLSGLSKHASSPWVPFAGVGILLFLNGSTNLATTAISREGRYFWISRSLPISPAAQVQAKVLHATTFSVLNTVILLGGMIALGLGAPLNLIYVLVGGLLACLLFNWAGILIDLVRPNLKWTDPQQAMKSNLNGLFGVLLTLAMGGVLSALAAVLLKLIPGLAMPALLLILGAGVFILQGRVSQFAVKQYAQYQQ